MKNIEPVLYLHSSDTYSYVNVCKLRALFQQFEGNYYNKEMIWKKKQVFSH